MSNLDQTSQFEIPPSFHSARAAVPDEVVIIAWWDDDQSQRITIQDFCRDGISFIPIFTSEAAFKSQNKGSGFEDKGVSINTTILFSFLKGGEHLIIDPGGNAPLSIHLPER